MSYFLNWFSGVYWFEVNTGPAFVEDTLFTIALPFHLVESCSNEEVHVWRDFKSTSKLVWGREDRMLTFGSGLHEKII